MRRFVLSVCAALLLVACGRDAPAPAVDGTPDAQAVANDTPAGQRIEADVRTLADDRMEGRLTGSAGFDLASRHVAARFQAIGLEPAGDDGDWFQRVPLTRAVVVRDGARLDITRNGRTLRLRFAEQFLPLPNFNVADSAVTAQAVFVGQAIHAPELGHDDFGDIDLRGRIAVVFGGAPDTFPPTQRAHYSASRAKAEAVAARGAVGLVMVNTAADEAGQPWARIAGRWNQPAMRLRGTGGAAVDGFPQLRATALVAATAADLVFADGPRTAAQLFDAARAGTLTPFALPGRMTLANRTRIDRLESRNVLARLPGRDPALAGQSIVHTAHLDHIGIGPDVDGDTLYNGAIDNALGVAIMLEAARELRDGDAAPRRTVVFAALTGEEQGLLGSTWLARYPTAAVGRAVANINIDMPVLTAPTRDVVAIGTEHSSLRDAVTRAAAEVGVEVSPDPFPEEVAFVRSDQYAFVRAGVPAVYLDAGVAPANPGQDPKIAATWFLRNCYHRPCDQVDLPIHYGDAARLARMSAALSRVVGDDDAPPRWNPGDFFGAQFGADAAAR
ncbi:M28 family metallopeptidase [Luteimonas deserti]|uniref:M20/M25/M40 family metallo-hydrolase n=1 Tax=Luteimonas deserti TaxID=2752306 RepID=A0A7Z0QPV9_9GAMM|nr:M28 family metallopeptidase [Luteimonas deserti]NYZ61428.1 M20/M25/M40 family metallo-hydrolase [Luteimonas deserti]